MKSVESLFCPMVKSMQPYTPIEPPDQIAKRLGIAEADIIKLDANENPYGTPDFVLDKLSSGKYYHIYPDPAQTKLRQAIADYAGVEAKNIIAGTGADELIDLICRLTIEPGDQVLDCNPTFGYYRHIVEVNRGETVAFDREPDFSLDLLKLKSLDLSKVKLVFLCSPNNPSGNLIDAEVLKWFLSQDIMVVLDEAYFEFSGETHVDWVQEHSNLLVLRTFSKCFALAGFRVGYGVMSEEIADGMMKIKPPYSVSVPAEIALITCLENLGYFKAQVGQLIQTCQNTFDQLKEFKQLTPYPSRSNFILAKVDHFSALELTKSLEQKGILVRYFNTPRLQGYIRVSMGTPDQMKRLFEALKEILP